MVRIELMGGYLTDSLGAAKCVDGTRHGRRISRIVDRKNLLAAAAAGAGAGAGGKKPRYGPIFYDPHFFTCYSLLLSLLSLLSLAVAYYLGVEGSRPPGCRKLQ